MEMKSGLGFALLFTATLWSATAKADDWSFEVTPYIWAPSFDTSLDIGPNPPVDSSTSLLDILDGAFLVYGEARRGAWTILGEFNYLDLSDAFGKIPSGSLAGIEVSGIMASISAGYAFYDHPDLRVEGMAGLRAWDLDATTSVLSFETTTSKSWVDPLIGLRFKAPLTENLDLSGLANIGGFGVGSDFQWEAIAKVDWSVSDLMTLSAGYRHLDVDFNDNGTVIDMEMSGPFIAVGFKF